jgi:hypothetical protein
MSGPLVPQPEQAQATYKAGGGLLVQPLPDEIGVPVRRDQFEILCEGGVGEARANRDLCLGIFFGTVAGLSGVLATTEWTTIWAPERRWGFLFWVAILFLMTAGSAVGAGIHWLRLRRTTKDSPYSRLKTRLLKMYEAKEAAVPEAVEK